MDPFEGTTGWTPHVESGVADATRAIGSGGRGTPGGGSPTALETKFADPTRPERQEEEETPQATVQQPRRRATSKTKPETQGVDTPGRARDVHTQTENETEESSASTTAPTRTSRAAPRRNLLRARYDQRCQSCRGEIRRGDLVHKIVGKGWCHEGCLS